MLEKNIVVMFLTEENILVNMSTDYANVFDLYRFFIISKGTPLNVVSHIIRNIDIKKITKKNVIKFTHFLDEEEKEVVLYIATTLNQHTEKEGKLFNLIKEMNKNNIEYFIKTNSPIPIVSDGLSQALKDI